MHTDEYHKTAKQNVVLKKAQISYLVHTTRFWNNLHPARSRSNDWKTK